MARRGPGRLADVRPLPLRRGDVVRVRGQGLPPYSQRSWTAEERSPLHFERGFFRLSGPHRVEVMLAHPLGIVEVAEGPLSGTSIDVASKAMALTTTGSPVTELRRRMEVHGDVLRYELHMAMRDVPLTRHLTGELGRA